MADLELTIKKQESEKQTKEHQIRTLQEEMMAQDELIAKQNKEKKSMEEVSLPTQEGQGQGGEGRDRDRTSES